MNAEKPPVGPVDAGPDVLDNANPIDQVFHNKRRADFAKAVKGGLTDQSLQEWDHERRAREYAKLHNSVMTGDTKSQLNPDGATGEDVAYIAKLREMQEADQATAEQGTDGVQGQNPDEIVKDQTDDKDHDNNLKPNETQTERELRQEIERLHGENQDLRGEVAQLRQTVEQLVEEIKKLNSNGQTPEDPGKAPEKEKIFEIANESEARDPENILDLKEMFEGNLEEQLAGLTDEQRNDPDFVNGFQSKLLDLLVEDYLSNITDKDVRERLTRTVTLGVHVPFEDLRHWQLKPEGPEGPEEPPVVPVDLGFWGKVRNGFRRGGNLVNINTPIIYLSTIGVGRGGNGQPIIAAVPTANLSPDTQVTQEERRRRCLWPVIGALAVGAGLGYLLSRGIHIGGGGGGTTKEVVAAAGATGDHVSTASRHVNEWANPIAGNHVMGVEVPKGGSWDLNQHIPQGNHVLTAPDGSTYAGGQKLPDGGVSSMWQSDGDLSRSAAKFVHEHGGNVVQQANQIPNGGLHNLNLDQIVPGSNA